MYSPLSVFLGIKTESFLGRDIPRVNRKRKGESVAVSQPEINKDYMREDRALVNNFF